MDIRPDLSYVDLCGTTLSGVNLTRAAAARQSTV
jgi:uncharacterized protein YjbI with pentapeptide repeats